MFLCFFTVMSLESLDRALAGYELIPLGNRCREPHALIPNSISCSLLRGN